MDRSGFLMVLCIWHLLDCLIARHVVIGVYPFQAKEPLVSYGRSCHVLLPSARSSPWKPSFTVVTVNSRHCVASSLSIQRKNASQWFIAAEAGNFRTCRNRYTPTAVARFWYQLGHNNISMPRLLQKTRTDCHMERFWLILLRLVIKQGDWEPHG